MNQTEQTFLRLISRSLFDQSFEIPAQTDWNLISELAIKHTVLPLLADSLKPEELSAVPSALQRSWKIQMMQSVYSNEHLLHKQSEVLALMQAHQIPCAILKGSSVSMYYPTPTLRTMGDIDLLVTKQSQMQAAELLQSIGYELEEEQGGVHHLGLSKDGIHVEVHSQPGGIAQNRNVQIRETMEAFFSTGVSDAGIVDGIPVLSDVHQALVLILHKMEHFTQNELGLRQLCDWALFVEKRMTADFWNRLLPKLQEFDLLNFTGLITRVCIEYLGLPKVHAPWAMAYSQELAEEIMENILANGNMGRRRYEAEIQYFTDQNESVLSGFVKRILSACRTNWPLCEKYPLLLPIAPFFAFINYRKKYRGKKMPKTSLIAMYRKAEARKKLLENIQSYDAQTQP